MVTMQYVSQVTKIHFSITCNWRKGTDVLMMDLQLLLTLNLWTLIIDISFILIAQLFGRRLEAWSLDEQYATVKLTTCWDTMDAEVEASTSASEVSHCREPRTIRGYPCKHALSQTLVLLALICLGVVLSVYIFCLFVSKTKVAEWKEKEIRNQFPFLAFHSPFFKFLLLLPKLLQISVFIWCNSEPDCRATSS